MENIIVIIGFLIWILLKDVLSNRPNDIAKQYKLITNKTTHLCSNIKRVGNDKYNNDNESFMVQHYIVSSVSLQKFLRPKFGTKYEKTVVLANKYCIIKYSINKNFMCFDKINMRGYVIDDGAFVYLWKRVCKEFDFSITREDISNIIKKDYPLLENYASKLETADINEFSIISINNMSVAELITLPGINIGKANKIVKYLKEQHEFNSREDFIRFAKVSPENQIELKKIIDNTGRIQNIH